MIATADARREQRERALRRANEIRLARVQLKRQVAAGDTTVSAVILTCPWEAASMAVAELLGSQRGWGPARCAKFCASRGLPENKTVGSFTERQRLAFAALSDQAGRTIA